VVEGGTLSDSRNLALCLAAKNNKVCVQLSDDISGIFFMEASQDRSSWGGCSKEHWKVHKPQSVQEGNDRSKHGRLMKISAIAAARLVESTMRLTGAVLGGGYSSGNTGMAMTQAPHTTGHFVIGDFTVHDHRCQARYHPSMTLKEDYYICALAMQMYGDCALARCNRLFVKAKHYTNAGGAQGTRTGADGQYSDGEEKRNCEFLLSAFPSWFQKNTCRKEKKCGKRIVNSGKHEVKLKKTAAGAGRYRQIPDLAKMRPKYGRNAGSGAGSGDVSGADNGAGSNSGAGKRRGSGAGHDDASGAGKDADSESGNGREKRSGAGIASNFAPGDPNQDACVELFVLMTMCIVKCVISGLMELGVARIRAKIDTDTNVSWDPSVPSTLKGATVEWEAAWNLPEMQQAMKEACDDAGRPSSDINQKVGGAFLELQKAASSRFKVGGKALVSSERRQ
jgi:hypothetical protein